MSNDLAVSLKQSLLELVAPLRACATDSQLLRDWLSGLGYTAATSGSPTLTQIAANVESIAQAIEAFDDGSLDDWEGLGDLLNVGRRLQSVLSELRQFAANTDPAQAASALAEEMIALLLATWLRRLHPLLFRAAASLGAIDARETSAVEPAIEINGTVARYPRAIDRFRFDAVGNLLTAPGTAIAATYLPNGLASASDVVIAEQRLFSGLAFLADTIGIGWRIERRSSNPGSELPPVDSTSVDPANVPDDTVEHPDAGDGTDPVSEPEPPPGAAYFAASFPTFVLQVARSDAGEIVLELRASSAQHPGALAGYLLTPVGTFQHTQNGDDWSLAISAQGAVPSLAITAAGVDLATGAQAVAGGVARIRLLQRNATPFVIGDPSGTRLEVGAIDVDAAIVFDTARQALSLSFGAAKSVMVIAASGGDGFLSSILPADGLRSELDLGLAWSSDTGLTFRGHVSLDATLPVGLTIAGITLSSVHVGLRTQDGSLATEISASLAASIGPVRAVLDRIGVEGTLTFPQSGGNLGPADLSLGLKGPSGVGLSVDAHGVVSGGGFLFHDDTQGLYAGAMQLTIREQITLKAFGLIATRMPDGSRGYSLIVFITAEDFRPIQLGLGFTLLGIGGMVGVNRTFDQEFLRQGLKSGTLATLLFPRDPVGNAPALIRGLASAFPARPGSYLLGLLAKIGWFTPTLVLMDLALILEFGSRTRLLALGRISARLPSADNDLVRINMEALGVIDFDASTAAIDAVLVDSRLSYKFAITGSAALRAGFGDGPSFILSVGGFNPRFAPPASVPALERVAIALSSGDNPRLVCDAYFAITSNTVQFGANASLYASAAGFSVEGDVGFDVLVQIVPLHFLAEFHAQLQLKRGSHNLFGVSLAGALEGPRPLRVSGKATFSILWCDFSVDFDTTLVHGEPPPLPPAVDVVAQLAQALASPSSWSTERSATATHGVALRGLPATSAAGPIVLDPLGQLTVRQQIVPLDTARDIDTFGGAPVAGARRFRVTAALSGTPLLSTAVQASFAPAQFFVMSDDEKLAAPSSESMDAGYVFGDAQIVFDPAQVIPAPLEYEVIAITLDGSSSTAPASAAPAPYRLTAAQLQTFTRSGAAARAPVRRVGRARFRNDSAAGAASFAPTRCMIMPNGDGPAATVDADVRTWSEYHAALNVLNRGAARWQIVPAREVEI